MVVDQNFLKVKRTLVTIFLFTLFINYSFADNLKFEKIVNLKGPWGSTFINDTELLITEKSGEIKLIDLNSKKISSLNHNLNYLEHGQGGLLDILYKDDFVYISYTENRGNWKTSTSIAKSKFNKKDLIFKNIFQADPPIDSGYHFGSRLAIKDNFLFASAGERGEGMIAQDPTKHPGSIIRINIDGSIPKDNPKFEGKSDWLPEIYQIGIRNPQGLTLSSFPSDVWAVQWDSTTKKGTVEKNDLSVSTITSISDFQSFIDEFDAKKAEIYKAIASSPLTDEEKLANFRIERTRRLNICDWTQLPDSPLSSTKKAEWATYRQALRDLPDQSGFPWEADGMTWPTKPTS